MPKESITLKNRQEISLMREGGRKLARVMEELKKAVRPGITTGALNLLAKKLILESGAELAFQGYQGFPAAICASVNAEVVHCVPNTHALKEGDVVSLDIGLQYKGYYLDMAETIGAGAISFQARHLIHATKKALRLAMKKARPGATTGDIGNTIERFVESQGLNVVREFVGHGIGRALHEEPAIPNFGRRREGVALEAGMVIAIEPIVVAGKARLKKLPDGHGVATLDGSLAAHFEHTAAVTEDGHTVLTMI
jgi:methionyl aminopeptidase